MLILLNKERSDLFALPVFIVSELEQRTNKPSK